MFFNKTKAPERAQVYVEYEKTPPVPDSVKTQCELFDDNRVGVFCPVIKGSCTPTCEAYWKSTAELNPAELRNGKKVWYAKRGCCQHPLVGKGRPITRPILINSLTGGGGS